MGTKIYSDLIKSPKWQKRRLEILQRDNFTCQECGDTESQLHVHHIGYADNPLEVNPKLLKTLCVSCHDYETEWLNSLKPCLFQDLRNVGLNASALSSLAWLFESSKDRGWDEYTIGLISDLINNDEFWEWAINKFNEKYKIGING